MTRTSAYGLVLGVLAIALCFVAARGPLAEAQSIGIAPGSIEVEDALRGSSYTRDFRIINQLPEAQVYGLAVDGEAASWITLFNAEDRTAPIDEIVALPNEGARVIVEIDIPDDTANGSYVAEISLGGSADEREEGEGLGIATGIALDVTVDVTGTQRLEGIVSAIRIPDTEVGLPMRSRIDFTNVGNVQAEPKVQLAIINGDEIVGEVSQVHGPVDIETSRTLKTEWDTSEADPAIYQVMVRVELSDDVVAAFELLEVQVWPRGHFTREGQLERLELEIAPNPGGVGLINAIFKNSGEIDTQAYFIGQVFREGELIGTTESAELLVETGEVGRLDVFFDTFERGGYTVEGIVNYEGKETGTKTLTFNVPLGSSASTCFGQPCWRVYIGGLLVLAFIGAAAYEVRRRRSPNVSSGSDPSTQ